MHDRQSNGRNMDIAPRSLLYNFHMTSSNTSIIPRHKYVKMNEVMLPVTGNFYTKKVINRSPLKVMNPIFQEIELQASQI